MPTVLEHITGALRLIGVVAGGEQPAPEDADDAMVAFNQWLDSLSIQGVICHSVQDQVITWPAGEASRTFGPSAADIAGIRPVSILPSTYYVDGNVDDALAIISEEDYAAASIKSLSAPPTALHCNYTSPNVTLYLYPVPSEDITIHLKSVIELIQATSLNDDIVVPPGFLRAFRYGLAVELAPEFETEPSPTVQRAAMQSMKWVKRMNMNNSRSNRLQLPVELRQSTSNIFEG